jgi:hypothetical protein
MPMITPLVIKPPFKSRHVRLNPCISQVTVAWWLRSRDVNGSFPIELVALVFLLFWKGKGGMIVLVCSFL